VCFKLFVYLFFALSPQIGFLRRGEDGSTTLKILNPDNSGIGKQKLSTRLLLKSMIHADCS